MATATEIVSRALKRLRVTGAGESPSASQMQSGTDALNAMIAAWAADGITGDTLPLDAKFEQGIIAQLAVRMAGDFGKSPDAVLVRDADNSLAQLKAAYIVPADPVFDYALTRTPSRMFPYAMPLDGTIPWKANTSFELAALVTNAGNVYGCIQAGVSGSTGGPTGTGMNQADGSCIWDFIEQIITQ